MTVLQTPRAAEYLEILRERLPDKTLRHVQSVAEFIIEAAEKAGVDRHKAVTAALLHDLCKATSTDELLDRAQKYGLTISESQLKKPGLLHGPVAAEMAKRNLNVSDPEIYDAVFFHTTGRPGWCRLGQVLYVADFSEPLRPYPEAGEARRILSDEGFAAALRYVSDVRLAMQRTRTVMDPLTETFNAWLHKEDGTRS